MPYFVDYSLSEITSPEPCPQRPSVGALDLSRRKAALLAYMHHLEAIKRWLGVCIRKSIPEENFEEHFSNGVYMALLAHRLAPEHFPYETIYDPTEKLFLSLGLNFRYTDNINMFLKCLKHFNLPPVFWPETTDIYEKKNLPRVVYCLLGFSHFLYRLGVAPLVEHCMLENDMDDNTDTPHFTEEQMQAAERHLNQKQLDNMPAFGQISQALQKATGSKVLSTPVRGENVVKVDTSAPLSIESLLAAVNEAIVNKSKEDLLKILQKPEADFEDVNAENVDDYLTTFRIIARRKARHQRACSENHEDDESTENIAATLLLLNASTASSTASFSLNCEDFAPLAHHEVQGALRWTNMHATAHRIYHFVRRKDSGNAFKLLKDRILRLHDVQDVNKDWYFLTLEKHLDALKEVLGGGAVLEGRKSAISVDAKQVQNLLQHFVTQGNEYAMREKAVLHMLRTLNRTLDSENVTAFWTAFRDPRNLLETGNIPDEAAELCHAELRQERVNKGVHSLSHEDVCALLPDLRFIWRLNACLLLPQKDNSHIEQLAALLEEKHSPLKTAYEFQLDTALVTLLFKSLTRARVEKVESGSRNAYLTRADVLQVCQTSLQTQSTNMKRIQAVKRLNNVIIEKNPLLTFEALQDPLLQVNHLLLGKEHAALYQLVLVRWREKKKNMASGDDKVHKHRAVGKQSSLETKTELTEPDLDSDCLWLEDIQAAVDEASLLWKNATKLGRRLKLINEAVKRGEVNEVGHHLMAKDIGLTHVVQRHCREPYTQRMLDVIAFKELEDKEKPRKISHNSTDRRRGWLTTCNLKPKAYHVQFYYNVESQTISWTEPWPHFQRAANLLNREEIHAVVKKVNEESQRQAFLQTQEQTVVRLQALARGYLARERFQRRKAHFQQHLPLIIRLQRHWRVWLRRRQQQARWEHFQRNVNKVVRLQACIRMRRCRREYRKRLAFLNSQVDAAVRIQSAFRASKLRSVYHVLKRKENPSLSALGLVLHSIGSGTEGDYLEEIRVHDLKHDIAALIRQSINLQKQMESTDLQIGLLVKNRMVLKDGAMKTKSKKTTSEKKKHKLGMKELKQAPEKSSDCNWQVYLQCEGQVVPENRVHAYQHLLYLLQTQPHYLSRLVSSVSSVGEVSGTRQVVDSAILALYNYGITRRDEFLLLRLLKYATELEIHNMDTSAVGVSPLQFLSQNSLLLRLLVDLCRHSCHLHNCAKDILSTSVNRVLQQRHLSLVTNPVEVYKQWLAEMETQCGEASQLEYEVSAEQALEFEEVRDRLELNLVTVRDLTGSFLRDIFQSVNKLPYALRYICRVVSHALREKFPHVAEKEIHKVIGIIIFYRYLSCAIVNPECYGLVNVSATNPDLSSVGDDGVVNVREITDRQRKNLACISKVLHSITLNKGYGKDREVLVRHLNPFIRQWKNSMHDFLLRVMDVGEPEEHIGVDLLTLHITAISEPSRVHLTGWELSEMHRLILEYEERLASPEAGHDDPLQEVLLRCGDVPNVTEVAFVDKLKKLELEVKLQPSLNLSVPPSSLETSLPSCTNESSSTLYPNNDPLTESLLLKVKREVVELLLNTPHSQLGACQLQKLLSSHPSLAQGVASLQQRGVLLSTSPSLVSVERALCGMIAKDMKQLRAYRSRRRGELAKLEKALVELQEKVQKQEESLDTYERYRIACLMSTYGISTVVSKEDSKKPGSVSAPCKEPHQLRDATRCQSLVESSRVSLPLTIGSGDSTSPSGATKALKTWNVSGTKLHKKGVLVSLMDMSYHDMKHLQFSVTPCEGHPGMFLVTARYLGVPLDSVTVEMATLLQMQYQQVNRYTIMDKATLNVNLLLHYLNKKFYHA